MEKENKKPILSKRVIICLVIVSFLIIATIFVTIISTEGDSSPSGSFDDTLNEPNLDNNGKNASETEGEDDYGTFDLFGDKIMGIPFWIWMIVIWIIVSRFFWDRY